MSQGDSGRAAPIAVRILRILGYFVLLAAFFLPAVREPGHQDTFKGYFCAWMTLINSFNREFWHSINFLFILSGWINPLMLLYVAFLFSRKLRAARRVIAVLVLLFIAGTWVFFGQAHLVALVGHFAWIAGIGMILAGELFAPKRVAA